MEAEARYTWVGAAVLLLVAALVGALWWLEGAGRGNDFRSYVIHVEQQPLDGLEIGADVTLRGIKVGRVEDYALADDKLNRVRVEVRVDRRAPVRTNTVAVVTRNFVTGIASIALVTPEPAGPPLVDVPPGEAYPLIGEGRSDLQAIAGRVDEVGDLATQTLNNLNAMLTPDNREAVAATLRHARDLGAGLNERLATLDRSLAQVDAAARDFGRAAAQLGESSQRIAAATERGGERLDRTLAEADQTLAEARRTLQEVARLSATLGTEAGRTGERVEQTLVHLDDQLGAALAELRVSVEAATRVLDRLSDPRAALFGPGEAQLGPGERRP